MNRFVLSTVASMLLAVTTVLDDPCGQEGVWEPWSIRVVDTDNLIKGEFLVDRWFESHDERCLPLYHELEDSLRAISSSMNNPYSAGSVVMVSTDTLGIPTDSMAVEKLIGGIGVAAYPEKLRIISFDRYGCPRVYMWMYD